MAKVLHKTFSFNGGEYSPLLVGRNDLDLYKKGCKTVKNAFVLPQGSIAKRFGTQYAGEVKDSTKKTILVKFDYAINNGYMLEFGNEYIRFWTSGGGRVLNVSDEIYEITSPYLEAELDDLQFAQVMDTLYIVHENHYPRILKRIDNDSWSIDKVAFERMPLLTENFDSTHKIEITETAGDYFFEATSGKNTFYDGHVDSIWSLQIPRSDTLVYENLGTQGEATASVFVGRSGWRLITHNTWDGHFELQRSTDNTNWVRHKTYSSKDDNNVSDTGIEEVGAWYRCVYKKKNSGQILVSLSSEDSYYKIFAKIIDVVDENTAEIEVLTPKVVTGIETDIWSESAWSGYRGYPKAITFFEQRLIMANNAENPQGVWGSEVDNFINFSSGTEDDEPFSYSLYSRTRNPISWLIPKEFIYTGAVGSMWKFGSSDGRDPITPTNALARQQAEVGTVQAESAGDAVLVLDRWGKRIHELAYDYDTDSWKIPDMSVLSEHLTKDSPIVKIAWQQSPANILWCIKENGEILSFTYQRANQVTAWARHETPKGLFKDVEVVTGSCGDEIWFIIERTINDETKKFVEFMQMPQFEIKYGEFVPQATIGEQDDSSVPDSCPDNLKESYYVDNNMISPYDEEEIYARKCTYSDSYYRIVVEFKYNEPQEFVLYDSCKWRKLDAPVVYRELVTTNIGDEIVNSGWMNYQSNPYIHLSSLGFWNLEIYPNVNDPKKHIGQTPKGNYTSFDEESIKLKNDASGATLSLSLNETVYLYDAFVSEVI